MKLIIISLLLPVIFSIPIVANQEKDSSRAMPVLSFSGYIKSDFIFDSRQNFSIRENMLLLYPKPRVTDASGSDINDVNNIQFIPFQTRITAGFSGTELLNARASGMIEGEFFGSTDMDVNGFRLRHAIINLQWQSGFSLMMGQFWHPLFITDCFPGTASMNTGIPFNPFARSPQLELTYRTDNFRFSAAAVSQIDFKSNGPAGATAQYLRNSGLPEFTGKIYFFTNSREFLIGAASAHKALRPRLEDNSGNKVEERIGSSVIMGFSKFQKKDLKIKAAALIGQDLFHLTMLGGYAIRFDKSYSGENLFDRGLFYTPVTTFSYWGEFVKGEIWEFGIFGGYSRNLGACDEVGIPGQSPVLYSRGSDINNLYRISPRISYNIKNLSLGLETEYTRASYAKSIDNKARPHGNDCVSNMRLLLFAFYYF